MKTKEVVITEFFNLTKVMNELTKGAVRIAGNSDPCSGGVDISVGTSTKPARVWVKLSCKPDDIKSHILFAILCICYLN